MPGPSGGTPSVPPAVAAARAVVRLAREFERALAGVDLSLAQYRLLAILAADSAAASMVADTMVVTRPSVTSLVNGLVAKGLVYRKTDELDRRRAEIVLTPAGVDILVRADAAVAARVEEVASFLPSSQGARAIERLAAWEAARQRAREHEDHVVIPTG